MKTRYIWIAVVVCLAFCSVVPSAMQQGSSVISNYNFRIEIDGIDAGFFQSVSGLNITQDVIEYQDRDDPVTRKRPGRVRYGDITLVKGYAANSVLNDWIEAARVGSGEYSRKIVSIILEDNAPGGVTEIRRWNCYEAFPKYWGLAGFNSSGNNRLTERLVLAIDWFEEVQVYSYTD
ncbi:MAG: phage tail protein [Planctomycetes bacterium]|nr:phage tail protein [Planctomycetota bacterium]